MTWIDCKGSIIFSYRPKLTSLEMATSICSLTSLCLFPSHVPVLFPVFSLVLLPFASPSPFPVLFLVFLVPSPSLSPFPSVSLSPFFVPVLFLSQVLFLWLFPCPWISSFLFQSFLQIYLCSFLPFPRLYQPPQISPWLAFSLLMVIVQAKLFFSFPLTCHVNDPVTWIFGPWIWNADLSFFPCQTRKHSGFSPKMWYHQIIQAKMCHLVYEICTGQHVNRVLST